MSKFTCPRCQKRAECRVVDVTETFSGSAERRRRECKNCKHRFTTYEVVEFEPVKGPKSGKAPNDWQPPDRPDKPSHEECKVFLQANPPILAEMRRLRDSCGPSAARNYVYIQMGCRVF